MIISIWKLENESWILVKEVSSMEELLVELEVLRLDGNEYRAEKRDGGFSSVLEV